jgi:citrate lyase subunit beta / citryl-CoA lyase
MLRLRSWMFVPGHSKKMVSKSLSLSVDAIMLDLEDGVVPALKAESRPIVAAALSVRELGDGPVRYVRVNGTATPYLADDLATVAVPGLVGIVLPKVETAEEVRATAAILDGIERDRGLPLGDIRIMLAVESAKGLLAAAQLSLASPRVSGLMFGAEDFSRDIGLPTLRTGRAREFIHARSTIVFAAAAAGIAAIDGVWPNLADDEGLRQDSLLARDLGFAGKSLIHPGQISAINEVFSPTAEDLDLARRLIADFETAVENGRGSISFAGNLVDRPIYERACATVRLGERVVARSA